MPKTKKSYKPRKRFTRKKRGGQMQMFKNIKAPLPNRLKFHLKYFDGSGAGLDLNIPPFQARSNVISYRANSIFAPYVGIGGHQPRGFDELISLYSRFVVYKSKIRVQFISQSQGAIGSNSYVALATVSGTGVLATMNDYVENKYCKWRTIANLNSTDINGECLTSVCNVPKFVQVKDMLDNEELQGSVIANPVNIITWQITGQGVDPAGVANVISCLIYIDYYGYFIEPVQPAQS